VPWQEKPQIHAVECVHAALHGGYLITISGRLIRLLRWGECVVDRRLQLDSAAAAAAGCIVMVLSLVQAFM